MTLLSLAGPAWAGRPEVKLAGTLEEMNGATTVWQLPSNAPLGILFLAHGCNHRAIDFWPRSAGCTSCVGLPEEVRITQDALNAGLAVIAISSQDDMSRCWSIHDDGPIVVAALNSFRKKHALHEAPLSALGASSGGAFVLQLPRLIKLGAVVSQIMAIPPSMLLAPDSSQFPPTLFVHMPRDERTAGLVKRCLRKLKADGITAAEIEAKPLQVDAHFFSGRIDALSHATSAQLHAALKAGKLLDTEGKLTEDPRRSEWRNVVLAAGLQHSLPGLAPGEPDSLQPDASPLAEVLNVAWAAHEIVSDHNRATLQFILHNTRSKPEL